MAVKSVSIRIEEEMLAKIGYVADYEDCVQPDENVKPGRKGSQNHTTSFKAEAARPLSFCCDLCYNECGKIKFEESWTEIK